MRDAATGKFLRENSSQWKGGRFISAQGYVFVMVDLLPEPQKVLALQMVQNLRNRMYIPEHRAVAAATLGRPIRSDEVVHHVNGEKMDNRPENLEVVSRKAHSRAHREIESKVAVLEAQSARLLAENSDLKSEVTLLRNILALCSLSPESKDVAKSAPRKSRRTPRDPTASRRRVEAASLRPTATRSPPTIPRSCPSGTAPTGVR